MEEAFGWTALAMFNYMARVETHHISTRELWILTLPFRRPSLASLARRWTCTTSCS